VALVDHRCRALNTPVCGWPQDEGREAVAAKKGLEAEVAKLKNTLQVRQYSQNKKAKEARKVRALQCRGVPVVVTRVSCTGRSRINEAGFNSQGREERTGRNAGETRETA